MSSAREVGRHMVEGARHWLNSPVEMAWKHLLVLILLVIGGMWLIQRDSRSGLEEYSDASQNETFLSAIGRCDNANLQRAYELANTSDGAERYQLVQDVQPIVNCPPTIRSGETVLVTKSVQSAYVRMVVEDRCWPKISTNGSGEIVGCRPLPSASQKP